MAAGAALRGLQEWCRRRTDGYPGVSITNMTSSFRDGLAFCAIIHHHRPDLIDFHSLKQEDVLKNNHLAFSVAERELGIPALLDAEDMLAMRVPDRLSVITYVSQYYNYFNGRAPIGGATKRPSGPAESEPSTKKPTPVASAADKENVFKGNATGAQRHSPARARPGGSLASIGEGFPAGFHAPPAVAVAVAPPVAQGSTCTMCGLRVHLVQRHLVDGRLYHHNCFRCKECSNTLMPGTYKEGKEPGTYVCQHHRARSIYATTINAGTGATTTTATTTSTATTTTTGTAATTTTTGATFTTSSTSFLPSRLTSPSAASSRVTPGRDVPTIGKLNAAATPTVSQPTTPSGRKGRGIGATSPSPAARLTVSPVPENSRTSEARDTFFLSTPASGQTAPGWDRFEQKLPGGGSSDTPTSGQTGTPASLRSDKNRYEERDKAMENARQLLARRLPFGQSSTVAPTSNDLSPSSGKLSPTSRKRSPASGNLSATSGETPTVTPAGPTPIPLPRRTIPELVPSKWESSVSPVPKYTPSATPEKSPTRTRIGTGATSVSGGGGSSSSSTGTSCSPVTSLADSSVKTPGSIYADIVLRKATAPGQPARFPEKSSASKSGAGTFGVTLRPTKSPTPVAGAGTTSTAGGTTPAAATKAPSSTASGTTTFVPESGRAQSVTVTVTIPVPEQPRPVDGGGHRSTAQWEVPVSPPHAGPPGPALFGHGDTKGRGGSPSKTAETPKKTLWKKNPAPGYGYPPNRIPRRKPDTYMPPEEIQSELNSICLRLDEMQQRGVLLEAELRSCEGGDGEDELLVNWFRLIQEKNLLVRKESELAYVSKQQILEERHAEVEDQIRRIMGRPEAEKDRAHEQELLDELIEIVHDRNLIVENLERDRLRELEEDKALEDMLSTKDIFKSQEAKETGQEMPKDTGKETPKDTGKETPKEKKERKRAEQEKKDLEKKEKNRAEKERRDQEKQERQRAEKERKEKEKQEKERQQKEKQEKEKQEKDKQEMEKQEKEKQQKEKQQKEKQQKERQQKEKQEKEKLEKSKKNKEKAENKKNKSDTLTSETENGKIEA